MFSITVNEMTVTPAIPTFGDATIGDLTYTQGTTITPVTLPVATGGASATLFYSVLPDPPAGLTFTRSTRVLSGTPTTVGMTTHSYRVADIRARAVALMFTITVNAPAGTDTAPTFGGATIEAQFYTQGTAITPLTLPAATGGEAPIAYTLTPAIPGLRFNATTRVLTGTPLTAGVTETTYTVGDTDDNIAASDTDTLTFTVTVEAPDTAPTFGTATIEAQFYTQGTAITPLTLHARHGNYAGGHRRRSPHRLHPDGHPRPAF